MVDRVNSQSRIPLPARTNVSVNGGISTNTPSVKSKIPERQGSKQRPSIIGSPKKTSPLSNNIKPFMYNNGPKSQNKINISDSKIGSRKDKGFETFLMTGDMMIKTTSAPKLIKKSSDSYIDSLSYRVMEDDCEKVVSLVSDTDMYPQESSTDDEARETTRLERNGLAQAEHDVSDEGIEILNDIRDDSKETVNSPDAGTSVDPVCLVNGGVSDTSHTAGIGDSNDDNIRDSTSPSADSSPGPTHSPSDYENLLQYVNISKSAEKIGFVGPSTGNPLVRTSKSHENCLQQGAIDLTLVDIDIDDHACSIDQIACHDKSTSSLNQVVTCDATAYESTTAETSKSLQNSPDHRQQGNDRVFMPAFVTLNDSNAPSSYQDHAQNAAHNSSGKYLYTDMDKPLHNAADSVVDEAITSPGNSTNVSPESSVNSSDESSDDGISHSGSLHFEEYNMSELERIFHQPFNETDRPAASRLAKRLYNLDGFRKIDVSRHLCKKNDFNYLVAEEYLKYFDFNTLSLVDALRLFLEHFSLIGETQERERVLSHFTKRYVSCSHAFASQDACHTLTCAIMLLNTDLHNQNVVRKMTCPEFVANLSGLNDDGDFDKELLESVFNSIRDQKIEWASEDDLSDGSSMNSDRKWEAPEPNRPVVGTNPFLSVPDPNKAIEYKRGYVMRKCCLDADARKTAFGKRGWKMFYASLRDMILYMFKDEVAYKKDELVESCSKAIRIHHALASKATDYSKKQHILRLQTADWAEYLFQASDSKELQSWMDTINIVAATLSAPPLPEPVGSQKKFQKPLMPSSYTTLNLHHQLQHHEARVKELEAKIQEHLQTLPEKGAKSAVLSEYAEKEHCLLFELKRFKSYAMILSTKMATYPELDVHDTSDVNGITRSYSQQKKRCLGDRYNYHSAMYRTEHTEYDMV